MEIGAADRTSSDFDKHLAATWTPCLPLDQPEGAANSLKHAFTDRSLYWHCFT